MLHPIKRARLELGRPQWQVAAASGLQASRLSAIENARIKPRLDELERIAAALAVPLSMLTADRGAVGA